MFLADQELRKRERVEDRNAWAEEMQKMDRAHTVRMKAIIASYGWAGKSLVGSHAAMAAWLLVQHADHDVAFQRECLQLLETAVRAGEASRQHLAYLTDRVLVNEGKPQVYGTQFREDGPYPIEDEVNLGTRRLRMGLAAFGQYKRETLQGKAQEQTGMEPSYRPLRWHHARPG